MTERLSQLLHDEADRLDVPPVAADAALSRGRGLRRRRTAMSMGAAAAALVVIGGTTLLVTDGDDDRAVEPAGTSRSVPAFGAGSKVFLGEQVASIPDTVHSLHYTSAGVLVRSNPNDGASDGSGPETLTLVRFDGSTADLGTIPEGAGPATDPDEPVYALAEARGDGFAAVVRDAETGKTVAEVPLPDLPPSYWDVPPLSLDGGTLYVGYRAETAAVDLATGEHRIVPGMEGGAPEVLGGHIVVQGRKAVSVLDATNGAEILSVDAGRFASGSLSPDGRFLSITESDPFSRDASETVSTYDVATGELLRLEEALVTERGWTSGGDPFWVGDGVVTTCPLDAHECTKTDVPVKGNSDLRLAGRSYES
jgi:hypothetical protein